MTLLLNSSNTSFALTGLNLEDKFALGIASGKSSSFKIALVIVQNKNSLDNSKYIEVIRDLYKEQGEEHDGFIYDKYSGDVIESIDFDSNEGFDEFGHKLTSRSVIQEEILPQEEDSDMVIDEITNDELLIDVSNENIPNNIELNVFNKKEFILHIINYVSSEMNIDISKHKEYIVYKTINIFEKYKNKKNE